MNWKKELTYFLPCLVLLIGNRNSLSSGGAAAKMMGIGRGVHYDDEVEGVQISGELVQLNLGTLIAKSTYIFLPYLSLLPINRYK